MNKIKQFDEQMQEQVDTMAEIQLRFAVSHFLEYYNEKKMFEIILEEIESKKTVSLPRFIYALGILHVGEETALLLAKQATSDMRPSSAQATAGRHATRPTDFLRFIKEMSLEMQ